MDSPVRRRELLQAGGVITGGSLAGCGYLEDDPIYTSIRLQNFSEDRLSVPVTVYDPGSDEDENPVLFHEEVELEARDGDDVDDRVLEDAFETQRAIVELEVAFVLGGDDYMRQFTYFPRCPQDKAEELGHLLRITIHSDIEYSRSCGSA